MTAYFLKYGPKVDLGSHSLSKEQFGVRELKVTTEEQFQRWTAIPYQFTESARQHASDLLDTISQFSRFLATENIGAIKDSEWLTKIAGPQLHACVDTIFFREHLCTET